MICHAVRRPSFCHQRPVTLRCGNCLAYVDAYDSCDGETGIQEWVDRDGDPLDKCPECGRDELEEVAD